jgi:hypothetical protein
MAQCTKLIFISKVRAPSLQTHPSYAPILAASRIIPNDRSRIRAAMSPTEEQGQEEVVRKQRRKVNGQVENQDSAVRATTRVSTAPTASRNAHKFYDHLFGSTRVTFGKRSTGRVGRGNLKPTAQSPARLRTPRLPTDP